MANPGEASPEGEPTNMDLLASSVQREEGAWERLIQVYGPLVYTWCHRWGLQHSDADEVGQETFLKVARHLSEFRKTKSGDTFRGWLYTIAYRSYIDFLRKQRNEPCAMGGDTDSAGGFPMDQIPAPDDSNVEVLTPPEETLSGYGRVIQSIKAEFSDRDWQAFHQIVVEEYPANDVAAALNTTPNVVYLAKSRILRRLRQQFTDQKPTGDSD